MAAHAVNQQVVLVSQINDYQYYQEYRQEGEGRVLFGHPKPKLITSAYAACSVHVLQLV